MSAGCSKEICETASLSKGSVSVATQYPRQALRSGNILGQMVMIYDYSSENPEKGLGLMSIAEIIPKNTIIAEYGGSIVHHDDMDYSRQYIQVEKNKNNWRYMERPEVITDYNLAWLANTRSCNTNCKITISFPNGPGKPVASLKSRNRAIKPYTELTCAYGPSYTCLKRKNLLK